jgi:hypothetical protein
LPFSLGAKHIPLVWVIIPVSMLFVAGAIDSNNQHLAEAQGNNSNISSGLQLGNITNMSSPIENESENATEVRNITEISNATSGEAIPLQQIVTLRSSASDSVFNDVINKVKSKGGEIIYSYKELLNAFAFRAPNDQILTGILGDLRNDPSVESVTTDKTAGIMQE